MNIPENTTVIIDAKETEHIDLDVLEIIEDFIKIQSVDKNITVILKGIDENFKLKSNQKEYNNFTIKHKK